MASSDSLSRSKDHNQYELFTMSNVNRIISEQKKHKTHPVLLFQVPPLQSPPLVISATRSNPNLSPQRPPERHLGGRRVEEGGVRVTSSIQMVGA